MMTKVHTVLNGHKRAAIARILGIDPCLRGNGAPDMAFAGEGQRNV